MNFVTPKNIRPHWNYFLALEKDLENASRYVEFSPDNFDTYSVEFAHLLLSAASEIDTIAKCICKHLNPSSKASKIDAYRKEIKSAEESQTYNFGVKSGPMSDKHKNRLSDIRIRVPRYSILCIPWQRWANDKNPDWWTHYNKVKHERNLHFNKATLRNVLNALAGLLAVNYLYCRLEVCKDKRFLWQYQGKSVTRHLQPASTFMRFERTFYADPIASLGSYISDVSRDVDRLYGKVDELE